MNYEKTKELAKSGHQLVVLLGTQNGMHEAASLVQRMAGQLEVLAAVLREKTKRSDAVVAENTFLMNMAASELATSWMFHKTMLGAQAALVCIAQGDIKSARDWLEGTTDEAGAEIPNDITVAGLEDWFNGQMISNGGKTGFLTRDEAEKAIRAETPATDAFLREVRAQGLEMMAAEAEQLMDEFGDDSYKVMATADLQRFANAFAAQLRQGGAA
ncbi:hypothetical protein SNQ23_001762 [Cronobacter dublinensis]|nr:hypothetical protein [Cronobacter dublinensis]